MTIGFAMCGSFCTFSQVFPIMKALATNHDVVPIFSESVCCTDSRFGTVREHWDHATGICGKPPINTIGQAEPIGPKKLCTKGIVNAPMLYPDIFTISNAFLRPSDFPLHI